MTAEPIEGQAPIDFDAIDDHYEAIRHIVGHDWLKGDEDYARFIKALVDSRRGPEDHISQNDVRTRLTEDTVKGPRIAMQPNRYSALWSRAIADDLIELAGFDSCTTSTTGNNGKPQKRYRWLGRAAP